VPKESRKIVPLELCEKGQVYDGTKRLTQAEREQIYLWKKNGENLQSMAKVPNYETFLGLKLEDPTSEFTLFYF